MSSNSGLLIQAKEEPRSDQAKSVRLIRLCVSDSGYKLQPDFLVYGLYALVRLLIVSSIFIPLLSFLYMRFSYESFAYAMVAWVIGLLLAGLYVFRYLLVRLPKIPVEPSEPKKYMTRKGGLGYLILRYGSFDVVSSSFRSHENGKIISGSGSGNREPFFIPVKGFGTRLLLTLDTYDVILLFFACSGMAILHVAPGKMEGWLLCLGVAVLACGIRLNRYRKQVIDSLSRLIAECEVSQSEEA